MGPLEDSPENLMSEHLSPILLHPGGALKVVLDLLDLCLHLAQKGGFDDCDRGLVPLVVCG